MTPELKQTMLTYEEIQVEIRDLTKKLAPLKAVIFPYMQANKGEKLPTPAGGNFEYKEVPRWKYSVGVEKLRAELEKAEEDDIAKGTAIKTLSCFFQYNSPKVDKESDL